MEQSDALHVYFMLLMSAVISIIMIIMMAHQMFYIYIYL